MAIDKHGNCSKCGGTHYGSRECPYSDEEIKAMNEPAKKVQEPASEVSHPDKLDLSKCPHKKMLPGGSYLRADWFEEQATVREIEITELKDKLSAANLAGWSLREENDRLRAAAPKWTEDYTVRCACGWQGPATTVFCRGMICPECSKGFKVIP